jgi:hypothetical protein
VLSSPKFNKRKFLASDQHKQPQSPQPYTSGIPIQMMRDTNNNIQAYCQQFESPSSNPDSKSWFQRWNLRSSDGSVGNLVRDKEFSFLVTDRPLSNIKANLTYAFLVVSNVFGKFLLDFSLFLVDQQSSWTSSLEFLESTEKLRNKKILFCMLFESWFITVSVKQQVFNSMTFSKIASMNR